MRAMSVVLRFVQLVELLSLQRCAAGFPVCSHGVVGAQMALSGDSHVCWHNFWVPLVLHWGHSSAQQPAV